MSYLTDILKTHMTSLPPEVQAVVTKLTAPIPQTEKEIAQQLKQQVTELKNQSIRKNQLQVKLGQAKSQYAAMLQDMQDIQTKLNEGQQKLKQLSDKYMAAVNQAPKPEELNQEPAAPEPIPMAVEYFVASLDHGEPLHGPVPYFKKQAHNPGEHCRKRYRNRWTQQSRSIFINYQACTVSGLNMTSICRARPIISSTPYGCNLKPEHSITDNPRKRLLS